MKVCFVISGFAYSGAEIVLEQYLMNNTLINPYFIIIYNKKEIINKFIDKYGKEKVYTLNINHSKNRLRLFPDIDINLVNYNIKKVIDNIRPDIIYANNTIESMLMGKFVSRTSIPSIAHVHDMKNSIKSIIRKYKTKKNLIKYDKVIMVSKATQQQWNIKDSIVVYNGISNSEFTDTEFKYKDGIRHIGYIGAISKRKGVDFIIESMEEILMLGCNMHIAYSNIDNSRLLNDIYKLKEKYIDKIIMYYKLDRKQVNSFYNNMDLIIVPSRHDPLPTVVLEAMARGTLVIGSCVDGIPEMIKNDCCLISNISRDELIKKIKEIKELDPAEINKIVYKNINFCKSIFNHENKVRQMNNILILLKNNIS